MSKSITSSIPQLIHSIRGQRVILDADLAALYEVPTRIFNQTIKRNKKRFPETFMFQLTPTEFKILRSQIVISSSGHGGRRYLPHVFTEHGALMAATVLNSPRAISMSIHVVSAFIQLRRMALSVEALARKVNSLEKGFKEHGEQFQIVFDAIRELMAPPPEPPKRKIGFHS